MLAKLGKITELNRKLPNIDENCKKNYEISENWQKLITLLNLAKSCQKQWNIVTKLMKSAEISKNWQKLIK